MARPDDLAANIAKIEAHLIAHPDDGQAFAVVAAVYMRIGRFEEAAHAYGEALRLLGESAQIRADYGVALIAVAGGIVTKQARAALEQALADQDGMPEARFYLGVAAEQEGDKAKAIAIYRKLAQEAPPDAPWLGIVRERLAGLDSALPGPAARTGGGDRRARSAGPAGGHSGHGRRARRQTRPKWRRRAGLAAPYSRLLRAP